MLIRTHTHIYIYTYMHILYLPYLLGQPSCEMRPSDPCRNTGVVSSCDASAGVQVIGSFDTLGNDQNPETSIGL